MEKWGGTRSYNAETSLDLCMVGRSSVRISPESSGSNWLLCYPCLDKLQSRWSYWEGPSDKIHFVYANDKCWSLFFTPSRTKCTHVFSFLRNYCADPEQIFVCRISHLFPAGLEEDNEVDAIHSKSKYSEIPHIQHVHQSYRKAFESRTRFLYSSLIPSFLSTLKSKHVHRKPPMSYLGMLLVFFKISAFILWKEDHKKTNDNFTDIALGTYLVTESEIWEFQIISWPLHLPVGKSYLLLQLHLLPRDGN